MLDNGLQWYALSGKVIISENKYYSHILTSKIIHLTFPKGAQSNSNIEL